MAVDDGGWIADNQRMSDASRSNADWTALLAASDASATAELLEFLRKTLARGFGRQLSDADLEDLTQETMLRVHDKLSTFTGQSRFTTWAAAIGVNTALMELRRRKHHHVELDGAITRGGQLIAQADGPGRVHSSQLNAALAKAIDEALSDSQREALLAELGGLPLMEIARRTNRSRGALYKMLHDARRKLRAHLESAGITAAELAKEAS